ncbi:MAG: alpha/beta hydrolase [Sulfurimonas sp.]|uniref:alpha/beta hydrolase n=1 Tax=Sulfurimonas sp. TaxID=2022749 RepID=UPI003D0F43C2
MYSLALDNGRILTYSEYGNKDGQPLFICHGLNSSRLEAKVFSTLISDENFRIIGIDRPGIGGSSFQKNRSILDFTHDIVAVADKLAIKKFTIIGTSAGTAYALACAFKIPQRLDSCHIISGLGLIEENFALLSNETKSFIIMCKKFPCLIQPIFWMFMGRYSKNKDKSKKFLANIIQSLDDVDKESLDEPKIGTLFTEAFREAYSTGSRGMAYDAVLAYAKPWGFELKDIKYNHIYLYNGAKDLSIPVEMGEHMHKLLGNSNYSLYKNDGHLSTIINQIADIKENITNC